MISDKCHAIFITCNHCNLCPHVLRLCYNKGYNMTKIYVLSMIVVVAVFTVFYGAYIAQLLNAILTRLPF